MCQHFDFPGCQSDGSSLGNSLHTNSLTDKAPRINKEANVCNASDIPRKPEIPDSVKEISAPRNPPVIPIDSARASESKAPRAAFVERRRTGKSQAIPGLFLYRTTTSSADWIPFGPAGLRNNFRIARLSRSFCGRFSQAAFPLLIDIRTRSGESTPVGESSLHLHLTAPKPGLKAGLRDAQSLRSIRDAEELQVSQNEGLVISRRQINESLKNCVPQLLSFECLVRIFSYINQVRMQPIPRNTLAIQRFFFPTEPFFLAKRRASLIVIVINQVCNEDSPRKL